MTQRFKRSREAGLKGDEALRVKRVFLLFIGLLTALSRDPAHAQVDFYKGKTMTYVVGLLAGDSTDLWSRAVTRNMVKHIPGNPGVIVQNMPGAGGLIAANYIYNVSKPDGLTLGSISAGHYFHQLAGQKEAQFDWRKFTWIGSSQRHEYLFVMRGDAPYKSIEDIRAASTPPKCASTAVGSTSYLTLKLIEEAFGVKINIVTGYRGGSEQDLAIERGEVQCRGVTTAAFLGRGPMQGWVKNGFLRIIVQTPKKRNPRLPDVPTVYELMDRVRVPERNRRIATVLLGTDNFGNFPTIGTPGIPADRVKLLRAAYAQALKEPDLLEEGKKRGWEVEYISGEELQNMANEVIDQPPDVIQRIKELMETK